MSIRNNIKLRAQRRKLQLKAHRKRVQQLKPILNRSNQIKKNDILLFCTARNERTRLPYFLDYYRKLGVNHFFFVDNDSYDDTIEYLKKEPDTSIWWTNYSYKRARFGVDWLNGLMRIYAHNHWTLVVDPDEFFVYPHCDARPLSALSQWLDASQVNSFGTILVDMYSKGPINTVIYKENDNPLNILNYFDSGNYYFEKNNLYKNLWIQGGPRMRAFFNDTPWFAPALNKIPFVKWHRRYVYASSAHHLLPRRLNTVYSEESGERASGCLLHTKFLKLLEHKISEEVVRKQHYAASREYQAYQSLGGDAQSLWTPYSNKYTGWEQLEECGLMSRGSWA